MGPDQTALVGAVWSGSTLFVYEASNILMVNKNIHFFDYALLGLIMWVQCVSWNARTFARPKLLINYSPNYKYNLIFPCLADDIAEPRPDMNIRVAAFTVSEKSINTASFQKPSYPSHFLSFTDRNYEQQSRTWRIYSVEPATHSKQKRYFSNCITEKSIDWRAL